MRTVDRVGEADGNGRLRVFRLTAAGPTTPAIAAFTVTGAISIPPTVRAVRIAVTPDCDLDA